MANVVKMGEITLEGELVKEEVETHARGDGLRCAHLVRDRNIKGVGKTDKEAIHAMLEKAYPEATVVLPPMLQIHQPGEKERIH